MNGLIKKIGAGFLSAVTVLALSTPVRAAASSLQTSIDAAEKNSTFKLTADVEDAITISKDLTLDLGDYTLTSNGKAAAITVSYGATLTIKGENGGVSGKEKMPAIRNNGTIEIESGTYSGGDSYAIINHGVIDVKDGTVTAASASAVENGYIKISDEYKANASAINPTMTVAGGTFSSAASAPVINNDQNGILYLKGGTFAGGAEVLANKGTVSISGGTYSVKLIDTADKNNVGEMNITGGSFTDDSPLYYVTSVEKVTVNGSKVYKITYYLNGGTLTAQKAYVKGKEYQLPEPSNGSYQFAGWYLNSDFEGDPVTSITASESGTKVLYAKWDKGSTVTMYRLYNPNTGEHFFTADKNEKDDLASLGWRDEGVGWIAPITSSEPVYRLYNEIGGEHHYTTSAAEKDMLVKAGWKFEKVGWFSDTQKTVKVYRQYNPNEKANNHNYTTSVKENDYLIGLGWRGEGIAWYAIDDGKDD